MLLDERSSDTKVTAWASFCLLNFYPNPDYCSSWSCTPFIHIHDDLRPLQKGITFIFKKFEHLIRIMLKVLCVCLVTVTAAVTQSRNIPENAKIINLSPLNRTLGPQQNNIEVTVTRWYEDEPIDPTSAYVVANRFMSILSIQDIEGMQAGKTTISDAPYDKVRLDFVLAPGYAGISREYVLRGLLASILIFVDLGFCHAEFTFLNSDDYTPYAKLIYTARDTTLKSKSGNTTDAVQDEDDKSLALAPRAATSFLPSGVELLPHEVWLTILDTLRHVAPYSKDEAAPLFDWQTRYGAYTELQRPGGGPLPPSPILTVEGVITACWKMPLWMLSQGRLAEAISLISYDGEARAEMRLRAGTRPNEQVDKEPSAAQIDPL